MAEGVQRGPGRSAAECPDATILSGVAAESQRGAGGGGAAGRAQGIAHADAWSTLVWLPSGYELLLMHVRACRDRDRYRDEDSRHGSRHRTRERDWGSEREPQRDHRREREARQAKSIGTLCLLCCPAAPQAALLRSGRDWRGGREREREAPLDLKGTSCAYNHFALQMLVACCFPNPHFCDRAILAHLCERRAGV